VKDIYRYLPHAAEQNPYQRLHADAGNHVILSLPWVLSHGGEWLHLVGQVGLLYTAAAKLLLPSAALLNLLPECYARTAAHSQT
jgi:hypothetical protein